MTHHSDFKQLVRARMRATRQPYTAARADLLRENDAAAPSPSPAPPPSPAPSVADTASEEWQRAEAEHRRALGRFLRDGRVTARGADRALRLAWTLTDLRGGVSPTEDEVAQALLFRDRGYA